MRPPVALASAAVACLLARPALASPLQLHGIGGRSPGLAGTGASAGGSYEAVYLNPAGLADVVARQLTLGGQVSDFALEVNGAGTGTPTASGSAIGAAFPVPFGGALADRVGFAIGLFVPHQALVRARAPFPGEPYFALLETRSQAVGILSGLGIRLGHRWSAGLSLQVLAALRGEIRVTASAGGRVSARSEQRVVTHVAPIGGVRYAGDSGWTFGLSVRGPSRSEYEVIVASELGEQAALSIPELRIAGVAQYDPLTAALEASFRPRVGLELIGQLAYLHWSAYGLPTEPPIAGRTPGEQPGFRDTAVPRVAAELSGRWLAGRWAARAGYAFLFSPAPEMSGRLSLLDNHRHLVSAGAGIDTGALGLPFFLDGWLQLHELVGRRHDKEAGGAIETGGRFWAAGLALGVEL